MQKKRFFFFYCLILLYLGQGSLQHNFIIIVTMSLFVAIEACTSRKEFTLIICKVSPHTHLPGFQEKLTELLF